MDWLSDTNLISSIKDPKEPEAPQQQSIYTTIFPKTTEINRHVVPTIRLLLNGYYFVLCFKLFIKDNLFDVLQFSRVLLPCP